MVGLKGWVTNAVYDGCFQRVRYTLAKLHFPVAWKAHSNGVALTFAQPLERKLAEDPESYSVEQWNYLYSGKYGSDEYSVRKPGVVGHDPVNLKSAKLLEDGRTVFLEMDRVVPVNVMQIRYDLDSDEGQEVVGAVYATINKVHPQR